MGDNLSLLDRLFVANTLNNVADRLLHLHVISQCCSIMGQKHMQLFIAVE